LGEINQPTAVPELVGLVRGAQSTPAVKQAALHALQGYNQDEIGRQMAAAYPTFRDNAFVREAGLALFASRSSWAMEFLKEVEETKTIHTDDVPYHYARRFKLLQDPAVDSIVDRLWPEARLLSSSEKTDRINKYGQLLDSGNGDAVKGRMLFLSNCGACHRLHDEGGMLGPELTGYDRTDPDYLLLHTVDPNADIREGYEVQKIVTIDDRTLEGRIKSQDGGTVTIEPPLGGKSTTLSKNRIKEMEMQQTSFMPERIMETMSDQQIRDLFSYLSQ